MFTYLSKKISMPADQKFSCISWNAENDCIACGSENGLVKILKLGDTFSRGGSVTGDGFLMKQKLNGQHNGVVNIVCWNEIYNRLTTCDERGLIVVWMYLKENWQEETVTDCQKSLVSDMRWSKNRKKIAIAYNDGTIIVESVDGNRLWEKDLLINIRFIEWSPDGKILIVGTTKGQIKVYDAQGNFKHIIKAECLKWIVPENNMGCPDVKLAGIEWYWGSRMNTEDTPAGLIIAYQNGRVQLMKNETDLTPLLLDCEMNVESIKWNNFGNIFVVGGNIEGKMALVQFYDSNFKFLRSLRIPGSDPLTSLAWDGSGLKLSVIAGPVIYIASVKPKYKWASMTSSIAYAFQRENRIDFCIIFTNITTGEKSLKPVKNLVGIVSYGDNCAIVTQIDNTKSYSIVLCNCMGNIIESKEINIEPANIKMCKSYILIASQSHVYLWQYKIPIVKTILNEFSIISANNVTKLGREFAFYIDETPNLSTIYDKEKYTTKDRISHDLITCADISDNILLIGRTKSLFKFSLPQIKLEAKIVLSSQPSYISLNCDSTKACIIDLDGLLQLYEFSEENVGDYIANFEKKGVWDFIWSSDTPNLYAYNEKYKLFIGKGTDLSEPITSENYFCDFSNLAIRTLAINEILKHKAPEKVDILEYIVTYEMNILSKFREKIKDKKYSDAYDVIANTNYVSLFRNLAEDCLESLDFQNAERALLKCDDYKLLQMVKKLQLVEDKNKQRAEILIYNRKFDDAESMYSKMERKDLGVNLRMKMGDWEKVMKMVKDGYANDDVLNKAYKALGTMSADKFDWVNAIKYYELGKNYNLLIEAYFHNEQFEKLGGLVQLLQDKTSLLELADKLQSVGMVSEAVAAYEKADELKKALDCCILLNAWDMAVEQAEKYNFPQVESLFNKYVAQLLEKKKNQKLLNYTGKFMLLIQFNHFLINRKINKNTEAAKILQNIADDLKDKDASPILIKKLYVIAAVEVESYKTRMVNATITAQTINNTGKTLQSLITSTINTSDDKALSNPWRGAEAWHFYILCQKQIAAEEYKDALRTALRLQEYELQVDAKKVYALIALTAYYSKFFKQCSRALVRLETTTTLSSDMKERIQEIASKIFGENKPEDPQLTSIKCIGKNCNAIVNEFSTHCKTCGNNFEACYVSGRPIFAKEYYTCKICRHKSLFQEIQSRSLKFCPLCHNGIEIKKINSLQQQQNERFIEFTDKNYQKHHQTKFQIFILEQTFLLLKQTNSFQHQHLIIQFDAMYVFFYFVSKVN